MVQTQQSVPSLNGGCRACRRVRDWGWCPTHPPPPLSYGAWCAEDTRCTVTGSTASPNPCFQVVFQSLLRLQRFTALSFYLPAQGRGASRGKAGALGWNCCKFWRRRVLLGHVLLWANPHLQRGAHGARCENGRARAGHSLEWVSGASWMSAYLPSLCSAEIVSPCHRPGLRDTQNSRIKSFCVPQGERCAVLYTGDMTGPVKNIRVCVWETVLFSKRPYPSPEPPWVLTPCATNKYNLRGGGGGMLGYINFLFVCFCCLIVWDLQRTLWEKHIPQKM